LTLTKALVPFAPGVHSFWPVWDARVRMQVSFGLVQMDAGFCVVHCLMDGFLTSAAYHLWLFCSMSFVSFWLVHESCYFF
jgi:hypothetical protein